MRILLFVSFIFTWNYATAQSISVESFKLLENDLTANIYGTTERDQNGDIAALIKVVTTATGFVFDGGMMGIVNTVQKAGEIWVYVPCGLQRITISHPDFGVLRNYWFPVSIEKAKTYELVLNTMREVSSTTSVDTYVDVSFDNAMSTSDIYLNGIRIATGSWTGSIIATTYLVEVRQEYHVPYTTTITLNPDDNGMVINLPALEPMTGRVSITSQPAGATVYMDGVEIGITPLSKDQVPIGMHKVELRKKNYRFTTMNVEVRYDETSSINNSDLSFTLERKILAANNVYAGGGYSMGHISGIEAYAGAYLGNVNIEAGYLIPQKASSTVWWLDNPSSWSGQQGWEYEYSLAGAIGYRIQPVMQLHRPAGMGL